MQAIDSDTTIVASGNQLSTFLDGEAIVLELDSGVYFGLAEVGARIWELLQQPTTRAQIVGMLLDEYEVERVTLEADVATFLDELGKSGLVDVLR